jgi:inhibitor of KinA
VSRQRIETPEVLAAGDAAVLVPFGEEMTMESIARAHSLARAVREAGLAGLRALVIGRSSLLIHYDPLAHSHQEIKSLVERLVEEGLEVRAPEGQLKELPVVYGGPYGRDLPYVAQYHDISEEEVVRLQSGATYLVASLTFAPGQPLLMGLPRELVMPRRPSPAQVPAGSVLVANQTALYPVANPTGWWQIGRTSTRLFDPAADPPTYLQPGDRVRFIPVTEEEYLKLGGEKEESPT